MHGQIRPAPWGLQDVTPSLSVHHGGVPAERNGITFGDGGASGYASVDRNPVLGHQMRHNQLGQRVIAGACHIQHVNGYHCRLKEWMAQCFGVAASCLKHHPDWGEGRSVMEGGKHTRCACMRRQGAPCNRAWGPGHHEGKSVSPGLGYRPRSDIHLGSQLDDPVGRDLELIRRPQGVALQQHEELAPQIEVPGALLHDERLVSHEEGGLHHPAA